MRRVRRETGEAPGRKPLRSLRGRRILKKEEMMHWFKVPEQEQKELFAIVESTKKDIVISRAGKNK
jgi:hypothetical protein